MAQRTVIIPLLARVELNASFLGSTALRTIQLETVNVVPFDNARLVARLHEATWTGGASPASVKVDGFDSYPAGSTPGSSSRPRRP